MLALLGSHTGSHSELSRHAGNPNASADSFWPMILERKPPAAYRPGCPDLFGYRHTTIRVSSRPLRRRLTLERRTPVKKTLRRICAMEELGCTEPTGCFQADLHQHEHYRHFDEHSHYRCQ